MKYQIFNFIIQDYVGKPYSCKKRARLRCDKLDLAYGAISHRIVEIADLNPYRNTLESQNIILSVDY